MRYGILFDNKKQRPIEVALKMAIFQFNHQSHTRHLHPVEARFHPTQLPDEAKIQDLTILPDRRVPLHHIRICTRFIPDSESSGSKSSNFSTSSTPQMPITHSNPTTRFLNLS